MIKLRLFCLILLHDNSVIKKNQFFMFVDLCFLCYNRSERELPMNKFLSFLMCLFICSESLNAFAAVKSYTPKKAQAVSVKEDGLSSSGLGASLLPGVIGLATNVIQINKEQKELSAKCEPTSREVDFVNKMVKEWAMAGAVNPLSSNDKKCNTTGDVDTYKTWVRDNYESANDESEMCFEIFKETGDKEDAVWNGFPKASLTEYCSDGSDYSDCSSGSKRKATNMWALFNMIDFTEKDYTVEELTQAKSLLEKVENCSTGKLAAKKREAFSGLVMDSINNMGTQTNANTGSVMEMVSGLATQKGVGGIGGIANMATQFLGK